ncbi:TPA: hypothetical protein ACH3X2_002427 [Trebouxia sp. C0005]
MSLYTRFVEQVQGEQDALDDVSESSQGTGHDEVEDTQINHNPYQHAWQKCLPGYSCVIQHIVEDYGYDKNGWFVLVNYETELAIIASFDEQSYFSSQNGMDCDKYLWEGTLDALVEMARLRRDVSIPWREILPEDHNFQHWSNLYKGICSWEKLGYVNWSDTSRWGPWDKRSLWKQKTPFADNITALYLRFTHAATLIQAVWRGWKWRLSVLLNPHTSVGRRRLLLEADTAVRMEPSH